MRRRDFIKVVAGSAAVWSLMARAQQTELPVVGYLNNSSPDEGEPRATAFRRGLQEAGYVEGKNVAIEYRWGDSKLIGRTRWRRIWFDVV